MQVLALSCLPVAAFLLTAQTSPEPPVFGLEARIENLAVPELQRCSDVIREVRSAEGLPALQRGPATGEDGYLIAAVDKRIDGCAVMQMHGNVNDLRPLPEGSDDFRLRPADD